MLFFSGNQSYHFQVNNFRTARSRRGAAVFQDKSLQVPTPNVQFDVCNCLKKRVLPFISRKKDASISVEAAVVLPMFLFFSLALLSPIRWLDEQRKAQTKTEQLCEELSQWSYIEGTEDTEEMITYEWSYREPIPFFSEVFRGVEMHVAAQRRKWIGLDGKLRSLDDGIGTEAEETMVYVGANRSRYHVRQDCHYISNQYEAISFIEAKERRTSSGHRLKPCNSCKPNADGEGMVYVTKEGDHYHGFTSCAAMGAYVKMVPLREVEHLGGCSYCTPKG